MQLRLLDLPAPVAPAMSRWGVVARLRKTARPAMSLPMATSSGWVAWRASGAPSSVAERHELPGVVGHLDADGRPAGDGRQDAHVGRRHGVGDVPLQGGDPGHLHPGTQLQLEARDRRPDGHPDQLGLHPVAGERLLQHPPVCLHLGVVQFQRVAPREVRRGRQLPLTPLRARPEVDLELLRLPTDEGGGVGWRQRLAPTPTSTVGGTGLAGEVVERRPVGSLCDLRAGWCGRRRARQRRHALERVLRLPPGGTRATAHASTEPDRDPPQGGTRGDEDTGQDHGKEQDDRPG